MIYYRLFCERCRWWVRLEDARALWAKYERCPKCGSYTDALPMG